MINTTLNHKMFMDKVGGLPEAQKVQLALDLFDKECFDIVISNGATVAPSRPSARGMNPNNAAPKPARERKARAPKEPVGSALADAVFAFVAAHPNQRGEDIATATIRGAEDPKKHGLAVRKILMKAVDGGVMYVDGTKRGSRFKMASEKPADGAGDEAES